MNKTFVSASFDLSSTPDVVRALPPTVGASLHNTALTLHTIKGPRPPNLPSQPSLPPHKETLLNNKFILGKNEKQPNSFSEKLQHD